MKKEEITIHDVVPGKEFKITGDTYFTCCDCGLTHKYKFKVGIADGEPSGIFVKAYRAEKLTRERRGDRIISKKI